MKRPPVSVAIVAGIYILAGIVGIAAHWSEFNWHHLFEADAMLAITVRLLAVVAGTFMFRAQNWARWLAIVWISFHVILSFFHSIPQVAMHFVLLCVFAFLLFRPAANNYFRTQPGQNTTA